jgi:hypothetical protein
MQSADRLPEETCGHVVLSSIYSYLNPSPNFGHGSKRIKIRQHKRRYPDVWITSFGLWFPNSPDSDSSLCDFASLPLCVENPVPLRLKFRIRFEMMQVDFLHRNGSDRSGFSTQRGKDAKSQREESEFGEFRNQSPNDVIRTSG